MRPLKRSKFNLSHEHLGTYEMGPLYPNLLLETVPGDYFEIATESISRFEAMNSATYSRIDKFQYYFYVPKRLVFADYYEKYRFGGKDGNDTTVPPYMVAPNGGYALGSLADHFGLPTGVANFKHSAMPFRAYELILNNWFLNDQLDTFFTVSTAPGLDSTTNTSLQNKKWEKDKYTSALPSPQLGAASYLPLGTSAPTAVFGDGKAIDFTGIGGSSSRFALTAGGSDDYQRISLGWVSEAAGSHLMVGDATGGRATNTTATAIGLTPYGNASGITGTTDLTQASAVSIPQLRISIAVQQFLERMNRSGTRPIEAVLSTFGVRIPDYRLDRSEFLGGSRTPVMIMPVEQTSESGTTPQGTLTGRGLATGTTGCKCYCHEDGYIIGLVCYLPRTSYSQGLDKLWSRETRYDEYLPDFAAVGDQEIKKQEVLTQSDSVVNSDNKPVNGETWGYEDRYNEFRHIPSKVHGNYRYGGNLNDHTLTRQFDPANGVPALNSQFVTADPSNRIFAVTSGVDHIEGQFYHNIRAKRPLPRFGNPGLRKV